MRVLLTSLAVAVGVFGAALAAAQPPNPPGWEPFARTYDGNRPVLLKGRITAADWSGLRASLSLAQEDATTGPVQWTLDLGVAETARSRGLGPEVLKPGVSIIVRGYKAKDGSALAAVRDVTLADGTKLFNGGSPEPR